MNHSHENARTTPLSRAEMVGRIVEDSRPVAEIAIGFGISERTNRKWPAKGTAELDNRSSHPKSPDDGASRFRRSAAVRLRPDYR